MAGDILHVASVQANTMLRVGTRKVRYRPKIFENELEIAANIFSYRIYI